MYPEINLSLNTDTVRHAKVQMQWQMAPECQHEGRPQKVAAHCCNCSVTGISNTGCAKWGMTIAHQLCCHLPASKTAYVCNKWQPSIVPFCKGTVLHWFICYHFATTISTKTGLRRRCLVFLDHKGKTIIFRNAPSYPLPMLMITAAILGWYLILPRQKFAQVHIALMTIASKDDLLCWFSWWKHVCCIKFSLICRNSSSACIIIIFPSLWAFSACRLSH